ncbi:response regulator [Novosphingobium sp. fls2-241-R2A-195]|uniref:hybrid sensor histidine kinase/response regulator n=1 Tax=Novosphingobium sp. fls2-241-R2A-195 TaxID=3040296 RepID=UPI00254C549B|nr:response regulator [Novosphingobium sp. fls2-241-R2A-195]
MSEHAAQTLSLPADLAARLASLTRDGGFSDEAALIESVLGQLSARTEATAGWPYGGGECGRRIRELDWSANPLGPIGSWSLELRATVANIVNSPVAKVLMWGPEHVMLYNDAYSIVAGPNHPQALGGTVPGIWPEIWDWNREMLAAGMRGELRSYRDQILVLKRNGYAEPVTFDLFYTPVYEADGSIGGVMCTCIDNSARIALEADVAASNKRFRTAMEAMHGVLWTNSADGRMLGEQPAWAALTGQCLEEYQDYGWAQAVHPDDREPTIVAWNAAVAAKAMFVHEHRVRRHDGEWRTFAIRGLPVLDEGDTIIEWVGVHSDITHQRAAEETLRELNATLEARVIAEIDERRQAEVKLAQAQKMETVGKLTGGVAHDFNNLLQVISGNLQLLAKDVSGNERAEARLTNALAGVTRGSKLASQLLAFGRRQALEPKVVNVSRFVRGMDDMLRRAIGEGIELETIVGGGLWNTYIDPVQVENAILNLAINSRDAMDGQGRLTIEVGNAHLDTEYALTHDEVTPGQYVMLAVSDTGTGMSREIIDKVFEPFFSTKGEGKGSGLGLSMVYGFVKQSGGHIKIYSEPGEGTTIKLYLPRSMESEDIEVQVDNGPIVGGTETVLVVEDDEEVRATVVEMLTDLGYRVLKAPDAGAALIVIESGVPIDLLFTDVVMPGTLKSPELARKARERLPCIAVLFTSGYTENSIVHGGKLDAGVELLSKPYTREALARRLRHVIANQRQRAGAENPGHTEGRPAHDQQVIDGARARGPRTVLLVEDDPLIRFNTGEMLEDAGYVVVEAGSAEDAMSALQTAPIDILVSDINLPGSSGIDLASRARDLRPSIRIVFASGDTSRAGDIDGAIFLAKPYGSGELTQAMEDAIRSPAPSTGSRLS